MVRYGAPRMWRREHADGGEPIGRRASPPHEWLLASRLFVDPGWAQAQAAGRLGSPLPAYQSRVVWSTTGCFRGDPSTVAPCCRDHRCAQAPVSPIATSRTISPVSRSRARRALWPSEAPSARNPSRPSRATAVMVRRERSWLSTSGGLPGSAVGRDDSPIPVVAAASASWPPARCGLGVRVSSKSCRHAVQYRKDPSRRLPQRGRLRRQRRRSERWRQRPAGRRRRSRGHSRGSGGTPRHERCDSPGIA